MLWSNFLETPMVYKKSHDSVTLWRSACQYLYVYFFLNSLWPSDVIRQQGTESTLAQIMACCLTAPSHYLNQCWLMISEVLWHSPDSIFKENTSDVYCWNEFVVEMRLYSNPPVANELKNNNFADEFLNLLVLKPEDSRITRSMQ